MNVVLLNSKPDAAAKNYLEELSARFKLELTYTPPTKDHPFLIWQENKIKLTTAAHTATLAVDFTAPGLLSRIKHNQGELLLRAVNLKKYKFIWDATAGLGHDAFILAAFGAHVTLFEQHPLIASLLYDGLNRARREPKLMTVTDNMDFIFGTITDPLTVQFLPLPAVIYLDPMFPERKKSAKVKKNMLFLQKFLPKNTNEYLLLKAAATYPVKKIVVKRSKLAPPLAGTNPAAVIKGKSVRFDIYPVNH